MARAQQGARVAGSAAGGPPSLFGSGARFMRVGLGVRSVRARFGARSMRVALKVLAVILIGAAGFGLSSGRTEAAAQAPAYAEVSGFPVDASSTGLSTVSLTPSSPGDLVVLFIELHSGTAPTVSSLSAPNIAWQPSATVVNDDPAVPLHVELWYGVATSADPGTTTITYSGSVAGNNVEIVGDSFHATAAGTWEATVGASADGSSATVQFPSLTSGASGGIYVGYSRVASNYASGPTSGFSYYETPAANVELSDASLAASTTYEPQATQSASGEYTSTAGIFYLSAGGGGTSPAPVVSAVSPTSGPVNGGGGGGGNAPTITREAADFPLYSESLGNSTMTIDPVRAGDLVVLSVQLHTEGISVTGVTGGNVGAWQRAIAYANTGSDTLYYEMWWGVATATGPSTVSLTYSANVSQWSIELVADSFTTGSSAPWWVVTAAGSSNPASAEVTWPALQSGTAASQLYWGASEVESSGTSTSTPGFTSNDTSNGNCFLFDGDLAASTTYQPTCGDSPAAVSTAVGAIFAAGTSGGGGAPSATTVSITGSNFAPGDSVSFGGSPATGVTVTSSTSITAAAPPGNPSKVGGTVDVTVSGPGGTSVTSPADEFTYLVSSSSYSVALAANTTSPDVGGSVTLTATANQDLGATSYGMSIVDASTGVILDHVTSGSSFSVVVSESAAVTQRYVAEIDDTGGANIQANSSPVIVTWAGSQPPPPPPPSAPTVTGVSPASGPTTGGTSVTVTGSNFASGDTVNFGSSPAAAITVNSATSITATTPAGSGTVDVTVSGAGGTSSTSPADQFTYTTAQAPAYAEVSGFPVDASSTGLSTVSLTPSSPGDLVVLFIELHSGTAPTVSSLSAPNIAWQPSATVVNDDPAVPLHVELWYGVATSADPGTTTITYSGSVAGNNVEIVGDSFHATAAGTWEATVGASADGSSATVQFPSLTSGASGGIYVGYSRVASNYASGPTSGFSYYETPAANVELSDASLAASTTYEPQATQSASGEYTSTAGIFYLIPSS
jgi:hypothetical protein